MTCSTEPADWRSAGLSDCATYVSSNYCTADGGYGSGWEPTFATFSIWATNGVTALQACCGCGGGVAEEFPDSGSFSVAAEGAETCIDQQGWVSSAGTGCGMF